MIRSTNVLKFRYYGDFHDMNYIYKDCMGELFYKYNDNIDGSPIFYYYHNFENDMINNIDKLNIYLRNLKIRKLTKNDLTDKELSVYTFFKFYIKCKKEGLLVNSKSFY